MLLRLLALLIALNAFERSATADEFGVIKGRLVWAPAALPVVKVSMKPGDPRIPDAVDCAALGIIYREYVVDPETKGIADLFVYLSAPKGKNPGAERDLLASHPEARGLCDACRFWPHALGVFSGQTLVFETNDRVAHYINEMPRRNPKQNRMHNPGGRLTSTFKSAEAHPARFHCDIHSWQDGYYMVFDHPFFAVTGEDGSFEIRGIPAGEQQVVIRHETKGWVKPWGTKGVAVDVKPGRTMDLGTFRLTPLVPEGFAVSDEAAPPPAPRNDR